MCGSLQNIKNLHIYIFLTLIFQAMCLWYSKFIKIFSVNCLLLKQSLESMYVQKLDIDWNFSWPKGHLFSNSRKKRILLFSSKKNWTLTNSMHILIRFRIRKRNLQWHLKIKMALMVGKFQWGACFFLFPELLEHFMTINKHIHYKIYITHIRWESTDFHGFFQAINRVEWLNLHKKGGSNNWHLPLDFLNRLCTKI